MQLLHRMRSSLDWQYSFNGSPIRGLSAPGGRSWEKARNMINRGLLDSPLPMRRHHPYPALPPGPHDKFLQVFNSLCPHAINYWSKVVLRMVRKRYSDEDALKVLR